MKPHLALEDINKTEQSDIADPHEWSEVDSYELDYYKKSTKKESESNEDKSIE